MKKASTLYTPTAREWDILRAARRSHDLDSAWSKFHPWKTEDAQGRTLAHYENALAACIDYMSSTNAETIIYKPFKQHIAMTREYAKTMKFDKPEAMRRDIVSRLQL
ncbi:MAG: hypothetical protein ACRCWJ_17190 [Casimicrobium sp.]